MGRVRAALVVMLLVVAGVGVAAGATASAAPSPFPPGDDEIMYRFGTSGATCGPGGITTPDKIFTLHDVPTSGAEVYWRIYEGGRRIEEIGPGVPLATGTTTILDPIGMTFGPGLYPRSVGLVFRLDVGGSPTYLGGAIITCAAAGATPSITTYEDFFPPCGVGDRPVFPDVPAANPFCLDVEWALDAGVTTGYPDGGYHPLDPVTRQAMAAFLHRASGSTVLLLCLVDPFPDVPAAHPFCAEIAWLAGTGIATGYADGTFRPGAAVSRQAMAAFLYRFAGSPRGVDPPCSVAPFPDVPTSHTFCGEIDWLVDVGITTAYADGGYHPAAPVSRQAMAAFLHRNDQLP